MKFLENAHKEQLGGNQTQATRRLSRRDSASAAAAKNTAYAAPISDELAPTSSQTDNMMRSATPTLCNLLQPPA
jgi:hypothetical protein